MENDTGSACGGREHFITALYGPSPEVWRYFDEWEGVPIEAGDEGSGVGERDDEVDEFALERLGIACAVKKCRGDSD